MPPAETYAPATTVVAALCAAGEALGIDVSDDITRRRFHAPARHRGCGIRERVELRHTAFAASFIESVEHMFGDAEMPVLHRFFGTGAFAAGRATLHPVPRRRR